MSAFVATSDGPPATRALAAALAAHLAPGFLLYLDGDLGAGKTAFVEGLVAALGGEGPVQSPTFTLENRYPCPAPFGEVLHVDLYRPGEAAADDLAASVGEALDAGAVAAVEWGDPVKDRLGPAWQLHLDFLPGDASGRRLRWSSRGLPLPARAEGWSAA